MSGPSCRGPYITGVCLLPEHGAVEPKCEGNEHCDQEHRYDNRSHLSTRFISRARLTNSHHAQLVAGLTHPAVSAGVSCAAARIKSTANTRYYLLTGRTFQGDSAVDASSTCEAPAAPDNGIYKDICATAGDTLYSG